MGMISCGGHSWEGEEAVQVSSHDEIGVDEHDFVVVDESKDLELAVIPFIVGVFCGIGAPDTLDSFDFPAG